MSISKFKFKISRIEIMFLIVVFLFMNVVEVFAFVSRMEKPGQDVYYLYDNPYPYKGQNCTWYAYGRAYEILGHKPKIKVDDAKNWWANNIYSGAYAYGSSPQVGAIACWNFGTYGHVAIVEAIKGDKVSISESSLYPAYEFKRREVVPSSTPGFQGYIYLPIVPEGEYIIESSLAKNMVIQTKYGDMNNGANVSLGKYVSGVNQKWILKKNEDGSYRVISKYSGKALDVEGVSAESEANIHTWDYVGGDNQKWYIVDLGDGWYQFIPKHSKQRMDVCGGSKNEWTNIWQYNANNTKAQKFKLISSEATLDVCPIYR